ncbi:MAG: hypothetical protein C0604_00555 [Clostridiales bacterium]|nr:MAG: hypothetical protein C0604_00555 [Clostridiales bacterium]
MRLDLSNKAEYRLMLPIVLVYGSIIIFPAYGPILSLYSSETSALLLSTLFLFSFSAGIFLLPKFTKTLGGKLWRFISLSAIIMVLLFPALEISMQCFAMMLTGLFSARIVVLWSMDYLSENLTVSYGKFFTSILFLSYAILYVFNAISPSLHRSVAIFFPVFGFSVLFAVFGSNSKPVSGDMNLSNIPPVKYLFPVFIIYISAGITYSGIYPQIAQFAFFERYYNVLPFLAALPFAFWVHKKRNVKALLWTGISLLGFSFLFHIYELKAWNYIFIQTLLQAGWAFMNSFVWLFASNIARMNRNPFYFSSIIATFLLGTSVGSATFLALSRIFQSIHMTFISLLPLLCLLVFAQMIPNNLKNDMENFESQHIDVLTRREKEIFLMLLDNMKNRDIAEALSISPNTLKKHCGSIYRKLDVENKTELIRIYGYMKTAN